MKKISKIESKYKLKEYQLELYKQISIFKESLKKDGSKTLKSKHLVKFIKDNDNSLMKTNLDFIWYYNKFNDKFLEDILSLNIIYEDIITIILQILCGNFSNTEKRFIKVKNKKLCSFYLYSIDKYSNNKILFSLCLKGFGRIANTYIYFISFTNDWEFKQYIDNFLNMIYSNNEFPIVEYDESGKILVKEILFEKKEIDKQTGIELYYPLKNVPLKNKEYLRQIKIMGKLTNLSNNPNDFTLNKLNEIIIKKIETNNINDKIFEMIEENKIEVFKLSEQEKKYIKESNPFILSGRPGTGKTTITLIKLFNIYYNYQLQKKQLENNINIEKNSKLKSNDIRIVFTSLSQTLCNKVQNIFGKYFKYKKVEEEDLKFFDSFREITSYPIFINFRKLLFMIDTSLTFQFFYRINLRKYEENINPEFEFYYSLDNKYKCNKYLYKNELYINFFYRNPILDEKQNFIILKESNENTFKKFYYDYLNNKNKEDELLKKLKSLNLNYLEIYAQLNSIIKGSYSSHLY